MAVDQFAFEYRNNQSFHAGYITTFYYALHKAVIANKLKHAKNKDQGFNTNRLVNNFLRAFHIKHRSA